MLILNIKNIYYIRKTTKKTNIETKERNKNI